MLLSEKEYNKQIKKRYLKKIFLSGYPAEVYNKNEKYGKEVETLYKSEGTYKVNIEEPNFINQEFVPIE